LFKGLEEEPLWKKILAFIIGFKVDPNRLNGSHYLPLEYLSETAEGKLVRHLRIFLHHHEETLETEDFVKRFSEKIDEKIWATPGLPFLVFITGGFLAALFLGDLVYWLTYRLITGRGV
ncbi:MAG: A24 family peptidase C-terminal domain-containing protein, partial [Nitrososphaerota archaeon]